MGELAVLNWNRKNVLNVDQVSIVRKGEKVREMRVEFRNYKYMKPGETAVRNITATYDKWCPVKLIIRFLYEE